MTRLEPSLDHNASLPELTANLSQNNSSALKFSLVVAFIYCLLSLLNILHHELWRDEWQAWLIAKGSASLADLFHYLHYERHPGLWYLLLFWLTRFTDQIVVMQILHVGLATAAVWVFVRYSPLPRWQNLLFAFGYFPFFEYTVISRQYVLTMLLVFICAAMLLQTRRRNLLLSAILLLLMQTSVYGLMFAFAFAGWLVLERQEYAKRMGLPLYPPEGLTLSLLIFAGGVLLFFLQTWPAPDAAFGEIWSSPWDFHRLEYTIGFLWKTYFPLPKFSLHFWDTNVIKSGDLRFALSLFLLPLSALLFLRRRAVLAFYLSGTIGVLIFSYAKFLGALRHNGVLFLLFIVCCWLLPLYPIRAPKWLWLNRWSAAWEKRTPLLLGVVLVVHLVAGVSANVMDWLWPFSAGRETAQFISEQRLDRCLLVGDEDYAATTVAGYLDRDLYLPRGDRFGRFIIWDQDRRQITTGEVLDRMNALFPARSESLLFVLNYPLDTTVVQATPFRHFLQSVVAEETYFLYIKLSEKEDQNQPKN